MRFKLWSIALAWALVVVSVVAPDPAFVPVSAAAVGPVDGPLPDDPARPPRGKVCVWKSLSQKAYVNDSNPLGISARLRSILPYAYVQEEFGGPIAQWRDATGDEIAVILWMPFGIAEKELEPGKGKILCWDVYPALCDWNWRMAAEWGPALRWLNRANGAAPVDVYYGSPRSWIGKPTDRRWAWSIAPCVEGDAGVIADTEAVRASVMGEKAYDVATDAGLAFGIEPWPSGATLWVERKARAYVLLQTVLALVSRNFPPSYNADPRHQAVTVLVPDTKNVTADELARYLDMGMSVALPADAPIELVTALAPPKTDTPTP